MTTLSPWPGPSECATTFSPSLVAERKATSSGLALTRRAYCARTSSVLRSMSPSTIGAWAFASANARPTAATGSGVGVM